VCSVTVPGERFRVWVNTSVSDDEYDDDYGSHLEIVLDDLKPTRRAQSRYVEHAEWQLLNGIERAGRSLSTAKTSA
jgi:hypothetical protein